MRARRDSNPSPELRRPLCYPSYTTGPLEKERVFAGVRYSPAILCLLLRGRRRMKNLPFSVLLCELGVSAASAGYTVLVDCHECSGSALGTELLCPCYGISVNLVCV